MFVSDVFFPQQIANPWIGRFFSRVELFGQIASSPQHRLPFWLLSIPNRHRCDFSAVFVVTWFPKLAANSQLPTILYWRAWKVRRCCSCHITCMLHAGGGVSITNKMHHHHHTLLYNMMVIIIINNTTQLPAALTLWMMVVILWWWRWRIKNWYIFLGEVSLSSCSLLVYAASRWYIKNTTYTQFPSYVVTIYT